MGRQDMEMEMQSMLCSYRQKFEIEGAENAAKALQTH